MKIEYFRQEVMRLEALLKKLKELRSSSMHDKMKTVMLCMNGSQEGFSLDECESILDDFERYIEADTPDIWVVISILLNYYCIMDLNELEVAVWHYADQIDDTDKVNWQTRLVEVDDDLLGEKKDWRKVYSHYCYGPVEEFETYYG